MNNKIKKLALVTVTSVLALASINAFAKTRAEIIAEHQAWAETQRNIQITDLSSVVFATLRTRLDSIDGNIATHGTRLDDVDSSIVDHKRLLDDSASRISDIENNVAEVNTQLRAYVDNVDTQLRFYVDGVKDTLDEAGLRDFETLMSAIESQGNALMTKIQESHNKVKELLDAAAAGS